MRRLLAVHVSCIPFFQTFIIHLITFFFSSYFIVNSTNALINKAYLKLKIGQNQQANSVLLLIFGFSFILFISIILEEWESVSVHITKVQVYCWTLWRLQCSQLLSHQLSTLFISIYGNKSDIHLISHIWLTTQSYLILENALEISAWIVNFVQSVYHKHSFELDQSVLQNGKFSWRRHYFGLDEFPGFNSKWSVFFGVQRPIPKGSW